MSKLITMKLDQWDIQCEVVINLDEEKFTKQLATEINDFWSGSESRLDDNDGNVIHAALKLYAAEFFQQLAFNNFKSAEWLTDRFNWEKGNGIEGFDSLRTAGITIMSAESWFIESEHITLSE